MDYPLLTNKPRFRFNFPYRELVPHRRTTLATSSRILPSRHAAHRLGPGRAVSRKATGGIWGCNYPYAPADQTSLPDIAVAAHQVIP
jgi:hypothetical protein